MDEKPKSESSDGRTPFERFEAAARGLVSVSKRELDKKVAGARRKSKRAKK
jgi:hypothetical protein